MPMEAKHSGRIAVLSGFFDECQGAGTIQALADLVDAAVREFGFRWFTLLHNVDLQRTGEGALFVTTYPSAWIEEALEAQHYLYDPIHAACSKTPSGFAWDRLGDFIKLSGRQRTILDRARDHGLVSGYTMPMRMPGEPEAIFSVAREASHALSTDDGLTVRLLGSVAYDRARELTPNPTKFPAVSLSPRQIDCLALVAQGKSDWEIGQILGLSGDTVHEYVESARRRYGVRRRAQLVLRAVRDGHLNMEALM